MSILWVVLFFVLVGAFTLRGKYKVPKYKRDEPLFEDADKGADQKSPKKSSHD